MSHRFIVNATLAVGPLSVRDFELRSQMKNVLRFAPGETVTLCDGTGKDADARLVDYGAASVDFVVEAVRPNLTESTVRVTLYCCVLKRENFELVVQKATEAGVARIVAVVSHRTVKTGVRIDRLQKIAKEAAEQSGRGVVPEVTEPVTLKEAWTDAAGNACNFIFNLDGQGLDVKKALESAVGEKRVGVFIGPEGGWDQGEIDGSREHGFLVATMGPRTLRAETAALIATYLCAAAGDHA